MNSADERAPTYPAPDALPSRRIISAPRSAIIITGAAVLPEVIDRHGRHVRHRQSLSAGTRAMRHVSRILLVCSNEDYSLLRRTPEPARSSCDP
jgi:hypothetical protein